MAVANSRKEVIRYVLRADRSLPEEQRTVFELRPLTAVQLSTIEGMADISAATGIARIQVGYQRHAALKASLVGWTNLRDEDGKQVPFVRESGVRVVHGVAVDSPPTDDTLAWLQYGDWCELADVIRSGAKLTAADVGN